MVRYSTKLPLSSHLTLSPRGPVPVKKMLRKQSEIYSTANTEHSLSHLFWKAVL